jgi:hypothetical protein
MAACSVGSVRGFCAKGDGFRLGIPEPSRQMMTANETLDAANAVDASKRRHGHETVCVPRGGCRYESLANEPVGMRWTWCPDCLTVYDDYRKPVNPIPVVRQVLH